MSEQHKTSIAPETGGMHVGKSCSFYTTGMANVGMCTNGGDCAVRRKEGPSGTPAPVCHSAVMSGARRALSSSDRTQMGSSASWNLASYWAETMIKGKKELNA